MPIQWDEAWFPNELMLFEIPSGTLSGFPLVLQKSTAVTTSAEPQRVLWLAHFRKQRHLLHAILPKQSNPLSVLLFWRYYWKIAEFRMNFRWRLSAVLEDASTPVLVLQAVGLWWFTGY